MHSVKNPDGEEDRPGKSGQIANGMELADHKRSRRVIRRDFKSAAVLFALIDHAPRMRETVGRLSTFCAIESRESDFNSSTASACSTEKRPDLVRRKEARCAPHPSSIPMSCAYVRT